MPIKIKTDLEFGQTVYLKIDPQQEPYTLVAVKVMPGNQLKFVLAAYDAEMEVWDFQISTERGEVVSLTENDFD